MKFQLFKKSILPVIGSIILLFSGCVKDDFDQPPVTIPHYTPAYKVTTIAALQALLGSGSFMEITNDTLIIKGIVTANDETGNIYKALYIQDNTAGLQVSIDRVDMYNEYKVGQRVFIKCKGLYLGTYGDLIQLGYDNAGAIGRIPDAMVNGHIFKDSLPGPAPVPELLDVTAADLSGKLCRLVKVEGVTFPDADMPYSDPDATTDRNIANNLGVQIMINSNNFVLRTSNYASFRASLLPSGIGNLVGILGYYNGTYQLYIRDLKDVTGFNANTATTILEETFASGIGGFTTFNTLGAQTWKWDSAYTCVKMSGYSGTNFDNQDWLISPAVNLSQYDSVSLTFSHTINKGDVANLQTNHTLWVSLNYSGGDPAGATWVQVTIPTYPAGTNWTFVSSGNALFPSACWRQANVHFAFKYLSSTTESATWEIRNVKLKGIKP